jgi:hypothetical protein
LNLAAKLIACSPGSIIELGLGSGRTYDHLREVFPYREIYVFERDVAAHPDCTPPSKYLLEGDFKNTLPNAHKIIGSPVALIHGDFGSAYPERDANLARWLANALDALLQNGTLLITDRPLPNKSWTVQPLPSTVPRGTYYMYRV